MQDHLTTLFLEREPGRKVVIGRGDQEVELEVSRILGNRVTLVFRAPQHVEIDRLERRLHQTAK